MRFDDVRALAHSVIFELHDSIQDLPGSTAARKLLVERALEYLRKLEASGGGRRRDLQLELAAAYQKIGEVQSDNARGSLSNTSAAFDSLQKSRRMLLDILPSAAGRDARGMLRDVDLNLAAVQEELGDEAGRAASTREAASIAWTLAKENPGSRRLIGDALRIDANDLASKGDWNAALPTYKAAVSEFKAVLAESAGDSEFRGRLAASYDGVASACKELRQLDCAIGNFRKAVRIRSSDLAANPGDTRLAMLLSYHLIDLAWTEHSAGAQSTAIADEERALALQRAIAAADAQNMMARLEAAKTLVTRGFIYRDNGDLPKAIASFGEANEIFESALRLDPRNQSTLLHLAWSNAELGGIYRRSALSGYGQVRPQWQAAAACYERADQYLQRLKLTGKLLGILDDRRLKQAVPGYLAECRRHL